MTPEERANYIFKFVLGPPGRRSTAGEALDEIEATIREAERDARAEAFEEAAKMADQRRSDLTVQALDPDYQDAKCDLRACEYMEFAAAIRERAREVAELKRMMEPKKI